MPQERTKCITLRIVKYRDEQSVATVLTRRFGVLSFMMPDGNSREAKRRRAITMPGGVYDALVDVREGRSIQRMRDIMTVQPLLLDSPLKLTLVMFVCDFLSALLRESLADELLYDYVEGTISHIVDDDPAALANLPIAFMVGLMQFMGIAPDTADFRPGRVLDLSGGVFRDTPPLVGRWLDHATSARAAHILAMDYSNMTDYRLTRAERADTLDTLIEYYSIHFGSVRSLRSLDILHTIFD